MASVDNMLGVKEYLC